MDKVAEMRYCGHGSARLSLVLAAGRARLETIVGDRNRARSTWRGLGAFWARPGGSASPRSPRRAGRVPRSRADRHEPSNRYAARGGQPGSRGMCDLCWCQTAAIS
jgi:hypothetical protein